MSSSLSQYDALKPFLNDRILSLVRGRLLDGLKFYDKSTLRPEFSRGEAKLALLLVTIANPLEQLTAAEKQLLESGQRENSAFKRESGALKQEFGALGKRPKKSG